MRDKAPTGSGGDHHRDVVHPSPFEGQDIGNAVFAPDCEPDPDARPAAARRRSKLRYTARAWPTKLHRTMA
jgi:hypothetical protein